MAKSDAPILDIQNLQVSFRTENGLLRAVDNLNLVLRPGEVLGIVGESGSGKSVSMLSVAGLIKKEGRVTTGKALFQGRDLLGLNADGMAKILGKEIGFVFQNPMSSLNPTLRIGPQVAEGMIHHGIAGRSEVKDRVVDLLDQVGIREPARRYHAYPHELSGGMRQRVLIAMALSCNPKLLIADEPTTALDVTVEKQILDLMMRMKDKLGLSIVLITHNLPVALHTCDRVLVLYAGKAMEQGSVLQIASRPAHPYTKALFASHLDWSGQRHRWPWPSRPRASESSYPSSRVPGSPPAPPRAHRGGELRQSGIGSSSWGPSFVRERMTTPPNCGRDRSPGAR
jgi:oligopeptide transport system ATP-binding protein